MKPYALVSNLSQLQRAVEWLTRQAPSSLYLDVETTGFSPRTERLVMLQLMVEGSPPILIDCREATDEWFVMLQPLISQTPIVGHNLVFDVEWLMSKSIIPSKVFCTQVAEQVIRGAAPKGLSLTFVASQYCGAELSKEERSWFIGLNEREEWHLPFPDAQLEYAANDLRYLPTIMRAQLSELGRLNLRAVARLEMRVLPAVSWMQANGIHIDVDAWRAVIDEQAAKALELEGVCLEVFGPHILAHRQKEFDAAWEAYKAWEEHRDYFLGDLRFWHESAGSDIWPVHEGEKWGEYKNRVMKEWRAANPNPGKPKLDESPPNLGSATQLKVAFNALGIQLPTAKNGKQSTNKEALEKLVYKYPTLTPFLAWRTANKVVSTYGEKLLARVEADGRIHPGFNQIGAETGRMSSEKPNFQNIPARTAVGAALRRCVVAPDGYMLLVTDFPNIELRILADASRDAAMLEMFASGMDLHTFTARRMFQLPPEVTDKMIKGDDKLGIEAYRLPSGLKARDVAKTINFGIAYGQSAFGFASKFGVDTETAEGFIQTWYETYPGAKRWLEHASDAAVQRGYSRTMLGRKRFYYVPDAPPKGVSWQTVKQYTAEIAAVRRAGANAVIQGTSADITKEAVALFYERRSHTVQLVCVVHDELVVQVREDAAEMAATLLATCMEEAARHTLKHVVVPTIEVHIGRKWEH